LQIALRLSPKDPFVANWYFNVCHAHVHLHEYDEPIEACRRSINLNKASWYPWVDLVSVYGNTGQLAQAKQALAELISIRPNFTVQWW
jgi:hypothetical protein